MRKIALLSVAASVLLSAGDRVELFGTMADANGSVAHAYGDPIITYQDQILSADEITYDRNTSIIEANGSINLFKAGQYHAMSDYSTYNLQTDTRYSRPYYMIDHSMGVWMSTAEAKGCENEIDLLSGSVSGCNSSDPLWKIQFSSADYDTDAMWVNLYNARLYVNDLPIMYLPYFGYPTDRTRRSGLLIPSFGLSNSEGFYYQQPIYFAPHNWWDLELRPQIRTSRGEGIYGDFRFIDTASSQGSIRMGYFEEQNAYAAKYNLANKKHYGYDLHYRHNAPLKEWFDSDLEGQSGLYVSGTWMNDVDYLNLQKTDETQNITANQVMSRLNAYYNSEENYFGTYLKHYQYLDQESNDNTIQTLPSVHYHRYLESFLKDHLLLGADATATNFYRPDGKNAIEGTFNLPAMLQTSLFNDYLDASYTLNTTARAIKFYGNERTGEAKGLYGHGVYAQLDHTFSLGSTLVRPYDDNTTHVINPNVSYTSAGSRYYEGYYKTYHGACDAAGIYAGYPCEFYTLAEPSDTLSLGVNNYLYQNGRQYLADRLSQTFRYDDQRSYYGELRNELEWQITDVISYYNQTAYNHDRNRITKEQNTLRYNGEVATASVSHYYTDELRNNVPVYASYWTADAAYQYNRYYRISGLLAYDYRADLLKRSEIGFLYTQRCFDFGLKYVQNRRPILTNISANDSVDDSYIFITIILKPIGGSEFNYKLTSN